MQIRRALLVLAVLGLALGACSSDEKVGSGVNVENGAGADGGLRLGETTTTAPPPETTAAPQTTQAPTTQAPTTQPPTTQQQVAITIEIANRSEYNPTIARVPKGSIVRWVNKDTIERQVVATDGAFASPKIPPGGTFDWKATVGGEHPYADPDVPFAAGAKVQVV